jgi:hypothetical protein
LPRNRLPASFSVREAEGEGFEPSIRLTTDNGFRALCGFRLNWLVQAKAGGDCNSARRYARRSREASFRRTVTQRQDVSMPSCLAAVDVEGLSGDEGGPLQVEDPIDDVADLARATERVDGSEAVV